MLVDNIYKEILNPNLSELTIQNNSNVTIYIKYGMSQPTDDIDKIALEPITRSNDGTYLMHPLYNGIKAWVRVRDYEALEVGDSIVISITEKVEYSTNRETGKVHIPYYKKMWLDTDDQILDMAVNGSVTEQRFVIKPNAGEVIRIHRLITYVQDTGTFDTDKWGNGIVMVNGMKIELKQNGVVNDLTGINPIRTTGEFQAIQYDLDHKTFGQGDEYIVSRFSFSKAGQPIRLIGDNGDELVVVIRDDLSALTKQTITAQGSYENLEY